MRKVHGKLKIRVLCNGKLVDEAVFESNKITIGRDPACDLVIDNKLVSGRHARITRVDAGYRLEDLGSTNGTLLDGKDVHKELLRVGAVAAIGKHKLEFIEEGESRLTESGNTTIAPRTEATVAASPADAQTLYTKASLRAFLDAGGRLAELRLTEGKATPRTLDLSKEISMVGKGPDADMRLSGLLMPATAFFVERSKTGYRISSGAKKVLLNGKPVESREPLNDGDEITFGSATLRFLLVG